MLGSLLSFFRCELSCSGLSASQTASPALGRISFGFADGILSLADGNVEYLLGKLDRITRTSSHETSIAQAAPSI
jgi:hypothetical protein